MADETCGEKQGWDNGWLEKREERKPLEQLFHRTTVSWLTAWSHSALRCSHLVK